MRIASCFFGSIWLHKRSIAVLRNSIASTKRMLAASAAQVHTSVATKKDKGRSTQAIATSCLIADSVESPSRRPPRLFQKAAAIRASPPRPGSAPCEGGRPRDADSPDPSFSGF